MRGLKSSPASLYAATIAWIEADPGMRSRQKIASSRNSPSASPLAIAGTESSPAMSDSSRYACMRTGIAYDSPVSNSRPLTPASLPLPPGSFPTAWVMVVRASRAALAIPESFDPPSFPSSGIASGPASPAARHAPNRTSGFDEAISLRNVCVSGISPPLQVPLAPPRTA